MGTVLRKCSCSENNHYLFCSTVAICISELMAVWWLRLLASIHRKLYQIKKIKLQLCGYIIRLISATNLLQPANKNTPPTQWLFLVPLIGGLRDVESPNWHYIFTTYIPLYSPYQLDDYRYIYHQPSPPVFGEPETTKNSLRRGSCSAI